MEINKPRSKWTKAEWIAEAKRLADLVFELESQLSQALREIEETPPEAPVSPEDDPGIVLDPFGAGREAKPFWRFLNKRFRDRS